MTLDQIRALKPGPELDRAVAEVIFGLEVRENRFGEVRAYDFEGEPDLVPAYSSTWAGLGLVVEEMARRGYSYTIQSADDDYHYYVEMWKAGTDDHCMFGKSLAEAVCRAALLALAAEKGQGT